MALTKAQIIDRVISFHGVDPLIVRLNLTPDPDLSPDKLVRQALRDLKPRQLLLLLLPALSDDELKTLDDVKANRLVRPIRRDLESAALGEMVELERERAAAKHAKEVNDAAPSAAEIAKFNTAPIPEPAKPGEPVILRQWVQGDDGRPIQVDASSG